MTISQNLCKQYLLESSLGTHVWGTDVMNLALYGDTANLDPDVITAYTATGECAGTGYVALGQALTLTAGYPKLSPTSRQVIIDFVDTLWTPAAFQTRFGLIFNRSKANKAVAVLDWGLVVNVTAAFQVTWPVPDDSHAIIRCGA